ncbi:MAG: 4Fe-4S binding protein [Spirochaetales bacterium]
MLFFDYKFYRGPWRYVSILLVLGLAIGGFFLPEIGLLVIVLMLIAIATNARSSRSFCSGVCPNGRALSASLGKISAGKKLPRLLSSKEFRRALCGLLMFAVVSFLIQSNGSLAQIGRVFWSVYIAAIGISVVTGLLFKPRAWCAFCPMGTLQDTLKSFK